jgi:hypothetical protein
VYRSEHVIAARDALREHGVEYMFIGKGAAIVQGFSDATQDIDIYPRNDEENNRRLLAALGELGFELGGVVREEILRGKVFIQIRGPFDLDLVFAPDGFESYVEAMKFKIEADGCPVLSIEGIIRSKRAAGRMKDRESLRRLELFREYLDAKKRR